MFSFLPLLCKGAICAKRKLLRKLEVLIALFIALHKILEKKAALSLILLIGMSNFWDALFWFSLLILFSIFSLFSSWKIFLHFWFCCYFNDTWVDFLVFPIFELWFSYSGIFEFVTIYLRKNYSVPPLFNSVIQYFFLIRTILFKVFIAV